MTNNAGLMRTHTTGILFTGKEDEACMQAVYSYGTNPKYKPKFDAARGQKNGVFVGRVHTTGILFAGKEDEACMQGVYSYGTNPKYKPKSDAARGQKNGV
ncbi:MAG: hypothetical protein PHN64_06080 [Desulfovibrionaceae bacterium]|nr:hypothetical protein [Desulfovibrionaceae bacterium]